MLSYHIYHILQMLSYVAGNEQTGCIQTEPNCKKFKRRNYSIYSSTF